MLEEVDVDVLDVRAPLYTDGMVATEPVFAVELDEEVAVVLDCVAAVRFE